MMSSIKCLTVYRPLIKAHPKKDFFNRAPMLWVDQQVEIAHFVSVAAGRAHWLWSNLISSVIGGSISLHLIRISVRVSSWIRSQAEWLDLQPGGKAMTSKQLC
jgi:hypothetical protein